MSRETGPPPYVRRRPTITDVAAAAGVSVSTVSSAMNGTGRVDPATRERVRATAAELGWRPRRAAQALRSGRTGTVALCIPPDRAHWARWMRDSDYLQQLTVACAASAIEAGLLMLLAPRPSGADELARLDVDGMLLLDPFRDDPVAAACTAAGLALVTVDREPGREDGWWAGNDHSAATLLALDHLDRRGARRVALFSGAEPWAWLEDTRRAYDGWCADRGTAPVVRTLGMDRTIVDAADAARTLPADVDAVLALPTDAALGVRRAAPGLAVVSGVDTTAVATAGITALDLRPTELGEAAVALLVRRLAGAAPGPVVVPARLRVRDQPSDAASFGTNPSSR
ncbi:LacI family DNA-binding transcriptional regulator [Pseudonocardia sp. NPDC046786]|uniref:LacI family DNA-binding transcriptional regulator n=1 Tax=Pseudonocardia sp. NPDC046786 TaxID=3155471 RepID=UPI0033EFD7F0